MVVHLNISEDKELRKAILSEVRSVLKSDIRNMLKPLIEEIVEEKYNYILEILKPQVDSAGEKIKEYLAFIEKELHREPDSHYIRCVSEKTSQIIESKFCKDLKFIDEVKTRVINDLVLAFQNNIKN